MLGWKWSGYIDEFSAKMRQKEFCWACHLVVRERFAPCLRDAMKHEMQCCSQDPAGAYKEISCHYIMPSTRSSLLLDSDSCCEDAIEDQIEDTEVVVE